MGNRNRAAALLAAAFLLGGCATQQAIQVDEPTAPTTVADERAVFTPKPYAPATFAATPRVVDIPVGEAAPVTIKPPTTPRPKPKPTPTPTPTPPPVTTQVPTTPPSQPPPTTIVITQTQTQVNTPTTVAPPPTTVEQPPPVQTPTRTTSVYTPPPAPTFVPCGGGNCALFNAINDQRVAAGVDKLSWSGGLSGAASSCASKNAAANTSDSCGGTMAVYMGSSSAGAAVAKWMSNSSYRAVLLSSRYAEGGAGGSGSVQVMALG